MKRRKRKMRLSLLSFQLASKITAAEAAAAAAAITTTTTTINVSHTAARPAATRLLFILASALACLSMLQPHLVNPTTQIVETPASGSDGNQEANNTNNTNNNNNFDDEPNFQREQLIAIKRLQRRSNETKMMTMTVSSLAPSALRVPIIKRQDYLEQPGERERDDNKDQHLDDLLAVESSRSPAVVGAQLNQRFQQQQQQQQQAFVAPYETSSAQQQVLHPRSQNLSSTTTSSSKQKESSNTSSNNSSNKSSPPPQPPPPSADSSSQMMISDTDAQTQLLRLRPHAAPLEPIYLKHNLPDDRRSSGGTPLKRSQIVALSHPSHTSAGSFALLPSWPNIYIAQRERPAQQQSPAAGTSAAPATRTTPAGSTATRGDYKVPVMYPDWSRAADTNKEQEEGATKSPQRAQLGGHQQAEQQVQQSLVASEQAKKQQQSEPTASGHSLASLRRSNLTTSEVEYEREDESEMPNNSRQAKEQPEQQDYGQKSIVHYDLNATAINGYHQGDTSREKNISSGGGNDNFNGRATASADSAQWTKLLQQAIKSQATKSLMFTNRSIISLTCDTSDMLIGIKFKQPFYGSVETNLDPLRQCRVFGNGSHYYEMRISLFECGTRQEMPRLYINNIQIQFRSNNSKRHLKSGQQQLLQVRSSAHRAEQQLQRLYLDDESSDDEAHDELKTLICSYPPAHSAQLSADSQRSSSPSNQRPSSLNYPNSQLANDLITPTRPFSIAFDRPSGGGARNSLTGGSQSRPEGGAGDDSNLLLTTSGRGGSSSSSNNNNNNNNNNDLSIVGGGGGGGSSNPSDRIIDVTGVDDPAGATRLIYYEPILLISGLILLAVALTLALVSSAYLARRHQRRSLAQRGGGGGSGSNSGNRLSHSQITYKNKTNISDDDDDDHEDDANGRVYRISPSQLANRSDGSHLVGIAPPLIGLSREDLLTKRPSEKRYSTSAQKEQLKRVRDQQVDSRLSPASGGGGALSQRARSDYSRQSSNQSSDGATSDSLGGGTKTESASTIEIPPLSRGGVVLASTSPRKQLPHHYQQQVSSPAKGPANASHRIAEATPAQPAKGKAILSSEMTPTRGTQKEPTPTTPTRREEYKHEMSIEKIVETTTSYKRSGRSTPEAPAVSRQKLDETAMQVGQQRRTGESQSPLPFGSFRSKLTSPIEYRRLQNISQLFGDSLAPATQDELQDRYRNKIARTMSDRERLDLRKLFQHDEVFRSNVVDSTDLETFTRKLRDNPKYSGGFSQRTWNLLREIMLDPNMSKTSPAQTRTPGSTRLEDLFLPPASGGQVDTSKNEEKRAPLRGLRGESPASYDQTQVARSASKPKVTNLDENKFLRPTSSKPEQRSPAPTTSQQFTRGTPSSNNDEVQQAKEQERKSQVKSPTKKVDQATATKTKTTTTTATTAPLKTVDRQQSYPVKTATNKMVKSLIDKKDEIRNAGNDENETDLPTTTAVRISQSNSARTRRDGSTMINIDSVTNISTPRSFSAFTRSSFEQVTRYQDEDSLPYMDDFSQCSMDDQRSFSSSSLGDNKERTMTNKNKNNNRT